MEAGEPGSQSCKLPQKENPPRSVEELIAWCRSHQATQRLLLLEDHRLASDECFGRGQYISDRVAAYALALLPSELSNSIRSLGMYATVRDAIKLLDACLRACEEYQWLQASPPPNPPSPQTPKPSDDDADLFSPTLGDLMEYYRLLGAGPTEGGADCRSRSVRVVENDLHHLAIIDLAADIGCCKRGKFNHRTARGLRVKYCRLRRVRGDEADRTPLSVIEEFVQELANESSAPVPIIVQHLPASEAGPKGRGSSSDVSDGQTESSPGGKRYDLPGASPDEEATTSALRQTAEAAAGRGDGERSDGDAGHQPDEGRTEAAAENDRAGGKGKLKLNPRQENILEAMLIAKAVGRDGRTTRRRIVKSINPRHEHSTYRRAFDDLLRAGYTQGEPGAEGGVWLTPSGRTLAEEVKRRNEATDE
jgi:hypothetical protein